MPRPTAKFVGGKPIGRRRGELRHHFAVVQDRPGDQVREEGDEHQVVQEAAILRHALLAVDQVAELGEGEERDAERQHDARHADMASPDGGVQQADQPAEILVVAERAEIGRRRPGRAARSASAVAARSRRSAATAGSCRRWRAPAAAHRPGSTSRRRRRTRATSHSAAGTRPEPRQQEVARQRDRQERVEEHVGVEQHGAACLRGRTLRPFAAARPPRTPLPRLRAWAAQSGPRSRSPCDAGEGGARGTTLTVDPLRGSTASLADLGPLCTAQAREERARCPRGRPARSGVTVVA